MVPIIARVIMIFGNMEKTKVYLFNAKIIIITMNFKIIHWR